MKASGNHAGDNFPMMIISTCAFFVLVVRLQGLYVPLPVRTRGDGHMDEPRLQANCAINLSYLSYAPIIFQGALVSTTCFVSEVFTLKYYFPRFIKMSASVVKHFIINHLTLIMDRR
jgi:preprotein translocase subunit SecY